jgi:hypothetical protein
MAENGGADRSRHEADGVDGEGLERPDPGIGMRKEQFCKYEAGDGAVEEKVVPLDRGADGGGDHCAAKLFLMLGRGEGDRVGIECGHERQLSERRPPTQ